MVNILMSNMSIDKRWCRVELREYIKHGSRAVIAGFGGGENAEIYDALTASFAFFGVGAKSVKRIDFRTDTPASAVRKLMSSDILVLADGDAEETVKALGALGLTEALKGYGGTVIGFGAGALIQAAYYRGERKGESGFCCFGGLGLADGIGIGVNFDDLDFGGEEIKAAAAESGKPFYALFDNGAVISDNGEIRTLGDVYVITPNGKVKYS